MARFPQLRSHVWLSSSGSGGRLKYVALPREAVELSARTVNDHLRASASDAWLNALPLFHIGGLAIVVRAQLVGARCEQLPGKWSAELFLETAKSKAATLSALVPTQVFDLVKTGEPAPLSFRSIIVGGGALDAGLFARALDLGWPLLPSYGMTETASQIATAIPGTNEFNWLPLLPHFEARVNGDRVLELRGRSLMTGWMMLEADGVFRWENPIKGGWYRTSDRAELRGGEVRFLGRTDDLVKIRGELVDVASLERSLRERVSSGELVLRCLPDERNGAVLHVVVDNEAASAEARQFLGEVFPPFALPESVTVGAIKRTATGKTLR